MDTFVTRREVLALAAGGVGAALVAGPIGGASAAEQVVTLYVLPGALTGPDGKGHDAFVPSSFVVKAGAPVRLTVIVDDSEHSIVSPDLKLNLTIKAGKKAGTTFHPATTTASLTVAKSGTYRWYCGLQCDGPSHWAMEQGYAGPGREGYMAGFIVAMSLADSRRTGSAHVRSKNVRHGAHAHRGDARPHAGAVVASQTLPARRPRSRARSGRGPHPCHP